jgi:hypothetical protein
MGITKDEVKGAIIQIETAGGRVGQNAIRAALGGRGSNPRIQKLMKEIRAEGPERPGLGVGVPSLPVRKPTKPIPSAWWKTLHFWWDFCLNLGKIFLIVTGAAAIIGFLIFWNLNTRGVISVIHTPARSAPATSAAN